MKISEKSTRPAGKKSVLPALRALGGKKPTLGALFAARRALWEKSGGSSALDRAFTDRAARVILADPDCRAAVTARPWLLLEAVFSVVDKRGQTVPFFLNAVQRDFLVKLETLDHGKPFFILKGRQQGFTTLVTAIQLAFAIVRRNFSGFTVADRADNTRAIFNDKARAVLSRLPAILRPTERFNSSTELYFDRLNSNWRVATASDQIGRSRTLSFVHFSEVAFYDCDLSLLQAGIGEALTPDAIRIYETTANGFNRARELWESGSCHNLFYAWWQSPEYRADPAQDPGDPDAFMAARRRYLTRCGCDAAQICWYAREYASYLDRRMVRQEYPCSPAEAFISSFDSVFDPEKLTETLLHAERADPGRRGYFTYRRHYFADPAAPECEPRPVLLDIAFTEDPAGFITLHAEPEKKRGPSGTLLSAYVIGGDTAGRGADFFTAKVVSVASGRTVATLRKNQMDEDLYAEQLYCLGRYYHDAMIGVEINFSEHPARVLTRLCYPRLYRREDGGVGFRTTARTKPMIVGELVARLREEPELDGDPETLRELLAFERKPGGELTAAGGGHDDLVMALAIAHFLTTLSPGRYRTAPAAAGEIARNFKIEEPQESFWL